MLLESNMQIAAVSKYYLGSLFLFLAYALSMVRPVIRVNFSFLLPQHVSLVFEK
jgi:hypothetical protein